MQEMQAKQVLSLVRKIPWSRQWTCIAKDFSPSISHWHLKQHFQKWIWLLGLPWLPGPGVKTLPSNAVGAGSIPAQGTKIPHASGGSQKKKSEEKKKIIWLLLLTRFVHESIQPFSSGKWPTSYSVQKQEFFFDLSPSPDTLGLTFHQQALSFYQEKSSQIHLLFSNSGGTALV